MKIKNTILWRLIFGDNSIEAQKKKLRSSILKLYADPFSHKMNDRFISSAIFDAKYTEKLNGLGFLPAISPSTILTEFYEMASKGSNAFLSHPFYRVLVKSKDIETKKLIYRLNRAR